MTTCSAIVPPNRSRAAASASAQPRSTNTTWRPDSSSVSGPNIGCREVTLQPCDFSARSPARSGDFSDPTSKMMPGGRRSARSRRIASVTPRGVARMMKSCFRSVACQSSIRTAPLGAPAGSATSTVKPCEARNCTNHPPILPLPPMTRARRPVPLPRATTLACSWVVSEERISSRSRSSASAGETPSSVATARTPRITSFSRS